MFNNYDIIFCSETWLSPDYPNSILEIHGKKLYRCDRNKRGGGVCIYINIDLPSFCDIDKKSTFSNSDLEILTLKIRKPGLKYMTIASLYRPPCGKIQNCIDRLTEIFSRKEVAKDELWFLGDYNVDYLHRDNSDLRKFMSFFKKFGCVQLVNSVTRPGKYRCSCLDWIVTNSNFVCEYGVSDVMISDHYAVHCIKKKKRENVEYVYRYKRNCKLYNVENFTNLFRLNISRIDLFALDDPNIIWQHIYTTAIDILEIMCPYRRYKQRKFPSPWLTAEIYREIRNRSRIVKLFNYTRLNHHLILMRRQRNKVNSLIESAKRNYIINSLRQNTRNPKKFWRIINDMLKGTSTVCQTVQFIDPDTNDSIPEGTQADYLNSYYCNIAHRLGLSNDPNIDPETVNDLQGMYGDVGNNFDLSEDEILVPEFEMVVADIDISKGSCVQGISTLVCKHIMTYFPSEITHLYRRSIVSGVFPTEWSRGCITVIPKSGRISDPANWRPITQTSIFAKVLEKLVYRRMVNYFDENLILTPYQYGFRTQRSTQQSVFDLLKFVYSSLNNKKLFSAICLDVCKAFDCINHTVLLFKLSKIGFSPLCLTWFKSYLTRTQVVNFNGVTSTALSCVTGIGQGTILGPLLFIFYINDIIQAKGNLMINMYADDCVMFRSGNNWSSMADVIQPELDNINSWCKRNWLKLSQNKSKVLLIGSTNKLRLVDYNTMLNLDNTPLSFVESYKYLGITIDKTMDLTGLVSTVKKTVTNHLFKLRKIRKFINQESAVIIYKQTILPLLDYSGFLLNSCNVSDRGDLQILQNDALRTCYNVKRRDRMSIRQMHYDANLLSLDQRRKIQLLLLMFIHKNVQSIDLREVPKDINFIWRDTIMSSTRIALTIRGLSCGMLYLFLLLNVILYLTLNNT